eukprot:scaffold628_cov91-Cylindrotheca_fusiformis.AAC.2
MAHETDLLLTTPTKQVTATEIDNYENHESQRIVERRKYPNLRIIIISAAMIILPLFVHTELSPRRRSRKKHNNNNNMISGTNNNNNNNTRSNSPLAVLKTLEELDDQLEGRILLFSSNVQENTNFQEAARVWRRDIKRPLAVIEVQSERDVQKSILVLAQLSKLYHIPFRIRSGGHNKAGYSTVAGGIVLSLKYLRAVNLIQSSKSSLSSKSKSKSSVYSHDDKNVVLANVQPGATVETVLDELLVHNDTSGAMGICGHVAEGGWVLGGGNGFMTRLLGLGIDNVHSFRIVLYNGTIVTANATSHQELFFALRGAGSGNYGVVTSMEYQYIHSMPKIQRFGIVQTPMSEFANYMYQLGLQPPSREFMQIVELERSKINNNTNNEYALTANYMMSWFSPDPSILAMADEKFEQEIAPLLFFNNNNDNNSTTTTTTVQSPYQDIDWAKMEHEYFDRPGYGLSVYSDQVWQGFLMPINNTLAVWKDITNVLEDVLIHCPNAHPFIELWGGGAISDVDINETAFPYRDALFDVGIQLYVLEEEEDDNDNAQSSSSFQNQVELITMKYWPLISQYLKGAYLNYPIVSLKQDEYPIVYWGQHLERLMKVKRDYDPQNIFSYEQSMPLYY